MLQFLIVHYSFHYRKIFKKKYMLYNCTIQIAKVIMFNGKHSNNTYWKTWKVKGLHFPTSQNPIIFFPDFSFVYYILYICSCVSAIIIYPISVHTNLFFSFNNIPWITFLPVFISLAYLLSDECITFHFIVIASLHY